MKYSLRKSLRNRRRRKEISDDNHIYPSIDANGCSNSNLNLVKPVKSKNSVQQRFYSSSDKIKSKVFEPRYDVHSNDDEDVVVDDDEEPLSSSINTRTRPFDRLTYQIRKSFRNTLTRQRARLESTNSNKRLILNKNNENQKQIPILPPSISTGLTSPLSISVENDHMIKTSIKRRQAPLAPTKINQSISLPIEINPKQQQQQPNFNRSFRTHFSFLRKKHPINQPNENINHENSNQKLTLSQRFNSLRRSFHIGNPNSSNNNNNNKGKRYLLSNE